MSRRYRIIFNRMRNGETIADMDFIIFVEDVLIFGVLFLNDILTTLTW